MKCLRVAILRMFVAAPTLNVIEQGGRNGALCPFLQRREVYRVIRQDAVQPRIIDRVLHVAEMCQFPSPDVVSTR